MRGAVEVHAEDSGKAVQLARLKSAKLKHVTKWTMRADYEQCELLPRRQWELFIR